jgi:formate dehydrogenase major subunit
MTNHYIDIRNADRILIIGSNAAENHPISFKWVTEAMSRGAKLISVDPRFTRTSSKAHVYARMRSGTDIAFMGGLINWIINDMESNHANYNMDYVKQYTNAAFIVNPDIKLPGDNGQNGLFSGFDPSKKAYDKSAWAYANNTRPLTDPDLQDPNCVFQLMKKQYSRYDLDTISSITGIPKDKLEEVYRTYAESGAKGRAGTIMYAMGTTQHTYGVQNIRTYAIVQLLLANMGVAGGGVNALRGTSNVQGSTDMCLLAHILPGYLAVPADSDSDLAAYLKRATPATVTPGGLAGDKSANWWGNYKKYIVSLLQPPCCVVWKRSPK